MHNFAEGYSLGSYNCKTELNGTVSGSLLNQGHDGLTSLGQCDKPSAMILALSLSIALFDVPAGRCTIGYVTLTPLPH